MEGGCCGLCLRGLLLRWVAGHARKDERMRTAGVLIEMRGLACGGVRHGGGE